ncbi:insulinase family protein [Acidipila sp. 4G-K13]|uniref:Insulinase family protein n=2 Tax=Paracidobacterium acidisoli TaxID=2303751 RepID=A0A372IR24_9BACT|nr:insulinase family protein [Paracidobacterium acidisoli]
MRRVTYSFGALALFTAALLPACAQISSQEQSTTPVIPPDARAEKNPGAWEKLQIPPLHPFHPGQPKRIELKNGMVILLEEDHELPFINGTLEIRGGSRSEPASKIGLIDLYSQAWRTSGTTTQNGDVLDDLLESKAAKVETGGDDNSTSVSWSCLKQDEDQVFHIAVDLLEHPAFNRQKLALAKQQDIAGIVRRNDDASGIASREAAKLVYGADSPYARQPEIATVMSVTLADLQAWHDKTVHPNNIVVAVSGDFDSAAMEKTLRDTFETMPRGPAWKDPDIPVPGPTPGVYVVNKQDVNQSNIWIVGVGTRRDNPDFYALAVMNEVFSGGFGSRLFQDVRTKLGLAYGVSGGYSAAYDHPGLFYTTAATKSESTVAATKEMLKDIDELRTEPFTEDEVRIAKDQLLNSFIFRYDTKEKVLSQAVTLEFYHYPPDFLERYRDALEKVTVADVERVAKKYIEPSKLAVLVVGNQTGFGNPPLTSLNLGPDHPIDITIPMPAAMRQQMMGGPDQ